MYSVYLLRSPRRKFIKCSLTVDAILFEIFLLYPMINDFAFPIFLRHYKCTESSFFLNLHFACNVAPLLLEINILVPYTVSS